MSKPANTNIESLGSIIRSYREQKGKTLCEVAEYLNIDTGLLSKIERGKRNATLEQINQFAKYFRLKKKDLLVAWMSDKIIFDCGDIEMLKDVLKVTEGKVEYLAIEKLDYKKITDKIISYLKNDDRISKAWVFGSFARREMNPKSDIDLMVKFSGKKKISLFDLADISHNLEELTCKKIDLVEEGYIKDFAYQNAQNEMKLIYEEAD